MGDFHGNWVPFPASSILLTAAIGGPAGGGTGGRLVGSGPSGSSPREFWVGEICGSFRAHAVSALSSRNASSPIQVFSSDEAQI